VDESSCERCAESFPSREGKRFCSERCRRRAERDRLRIRKRDAARSTRAELRAIRPCLGCGSTDGLDWWVGRMEHPGAASSRCHTCYLAYMRERYRANPSRRTRPRAPRAPRPRQTITCSGCGIQFQRRNQNDRCSSCAAMARSESESRRRTVIARGDNSIGWRSVGERDGWKCHLCGKAVLTVAGTAKQPMGATVDHLIPIAHGGEHVWSNVGLAHRACNVSRGARGAAQLRLVG